MVQELVSKIFMLEDYNSKEKMEEHIKEYIYKIKQKYPEAIVTREFYKGQNILVRATKVSNKSINSKKISKEREKDDWYIRQRGGR